MNIRHSFVPLAIALTVLPLSLARAADNYWNGNSTSWNAATSWSTSANATSPNPGAFPNAASEAVIFSISPVNTAQTVNLNGAKTVSGVTFAGTNSANTTLLGGSANSNWTIGTGGLTMAAGAGAVTIGSVTATQNVNVLFSGNQTWTLNSANTLSLANNFNVGTTANPNMVLSIAGSGSGGIVSNGNFNVGFNAGASGYVFQTSGAVTAANLLAVGSNTGYGYYALSGGNLTVTGGAFRIGTGGNLVGTGVMDMTSGTLTVGAGVTSGLSIVGSNSTDTGLQGRGVFNVTGGTINSASGINVGGRSGNAQLTIDGSALVTTTNVGIAGTSTSVGTGSTGIVNLNGGILEALQLNKGTGSGAGPKTAILNFNGGTVRASADNATFLQGLDAAYIYSDGATINTNGKNVTIAQNLLAPTGNGVSSITVTGSGYSGAPYVAITGGGGTGATAVANVDGSGNITSITVTNPGVGYTSAPTVTISGGNGTAGTPNANVAANTGGGLTKSGAGILTLGGANTYNGGTIISAGTLLVTNSSGSGTGTGAVTVNGGSILGGSGTIAPSGGNNVTISSGTLSPGSSLLTFNFTGASKLDFASGTFMDITLGTVSGLAAFSSAGDWLSGSGNVTLNITQGAGFDYNSSYTIFQNVTTVGFNFAAVTGIDGGYTPNLNHVGNDYVLSFAAVPEPGTVALIGLGGLLAFGRIARRRESRARR